MALLICSATHFPIRVGSKCTNVGRSPGFGIITHHANLPIQIDSGCFTGIMFPITVAGPRWTFTNFPFKSRKTPYPFKYMFSLYFIIHQKEIRHSCFYESLLFLSNLFN